MGKLNTFFSFCGAIMLIVVAFALFVYSESYGVAHPGDDTGTLFLAIIALLIGGIGTSILNSVVGNIMKKVFSCGI